MNYLLVLLFVLLPLYVWRFDFAGLPANFLLAAVGLIWIATAVYLTKNRQWREFGQTVRQMPRYIFLAIIGFTVASLIALLTAGVRQTTLGQWVVIYFQPLTLLFIYYYFSKRDLKLRDYIRYATYAIVAAAGALALIQYFTLATLPMQWWGNSVEPKRAIAFFVHANGFGLYITPLLAWLIPDLMRRLNSRRDWYLVGAWLLGAIGILLSLSRGAWLGLAAAAAIYILVSANRKYLIGGVIAAAGIIIVIAAAPNLRYRLLLPFYGEKSSVARISLWHTGARMIKDSPVTGKGINGFSENWDQYNRDPGLEHYNFPHNLFLSFWIDAGVLGLLSFIFLSLVGLVRGFRYREDLYKFGLALFIIALFVHGQIDTPYLKNDLAAMFWIIWAISI
jgi:putative inorganic carbon (hco3(-)) transporter